MEKRKRLKVIMQIGKPEKQKERDLRNRVEFTPYYRIDKEEEQQYPYSVLLLSEQGKKGRNKSPMY